MRTQDFWRYVDKKGPDECWLWQRSTNNCGYGNVCWNGETVMAHRVAWELTHGRPPQEGKVIMHSCDVRSCCNPAHLDEKWQWNNLVDMMMKGRGKNQFKAGAAHPNAKFTEEQVRHIKFSGLDRLQLAAMHKCSPENVDSIKAGRSWKHITRNPPTEETARVQAH